MNGDRWRTDTRSHKQIDQEKQTEELVKWESMERIVNLSHDRVKAAELRSDEPEKVQDEKKGGH